MPTPPATVRGPVSPSIKTARFPQRGPAGPLPGVPDGVANTGVKWCSGWSRGGSPTRAHANVGKDVKMVDTVFTAWAALKIRPVNLGLGVGRCCWILEAVFGGVGGCGCHTE